MEAKQFLAGFGHIASAPGGVDRVRQMIYQLAVTGSLTPRGDGADAGALLAEVELNRQLLMREKKYKRKADLEGERIRPPPGIALPPVWRWSRLLDIGVINPRNEAADEEPAAFVPMSGVPQRHGGAIFAETKRWGEIKRGYTHFANGDVVIAKITPCFENGKASVVKDLPGATGIGAGTTELLVFRPTHSGILPEYVYLFLRSPLFAAEGEQNMTGTAGQKRLPTDYFATRAFPLPPTEEQGRIVTKVDELMALCDQLEMLQQDHRTMQSDLRRSTLEAFRSASSPHELQATWARLEFNFGDLFSAPDDVKQFRGLVLDLAVAGLLVVPPLIQTSSASTLLEAIAVARSHWARKAEGQERKEALGMLRKLRTQSVAPPTEPLPEHWCWATLLQVSQVVVDCHNKTAIYVADGIPLIRTTDIRNGRMELNKAKKIAEETYAYWAKRMPPEAGDIFFTREAPMGQAAIVPPGAKVCLGQRTMLIRLFDHLFSNRFLLYVIQSPSFQGRMVEVAIGMTVKHLRVGGVENLMVPVPPKPEQDLIVDVVDRLFEICDQYERCLAESQVVASNLASAAVADLTGITFERAENEHVIPPKTELIAPLRTGASPDVKALAPLATLLARHNGEMSARDLWQRFGGEVDAFYAQLKTEVAHGWILEPAVAEMREKPFDVAST